VFPTAEVSGVVREADRPVAGGWIEFLPIEGTVGNLRSARIAADGSFRAERVAVGLNALRLVNAPIQMPQGRALFGQYTTPVRRVIPPVPEGPIRIELVDEALRFQAGRPRRPVYDFEPDRASEDAR
jgi:hypothetical protein